MRRRRKARPTAEQGAGDQGLMFGFACTETPNLMPAPIYLRARARPQRLTDLRKHKQSFGWIRPDCKTQVSLQYNGNAPSSGSTPWSSRPSTAIR